MIFSTSSPAMSGEIVVEQNTVDRGVEGSQTVGRCPHFDEFVRLRRKAEHPSIPNSIGQIVFDEK
ncbi:hypothetical protein ACHIPZ_12770 [Antrihabitans sp. NCIMB 15449]|uniref:Uncharacterized protein n=1 Tax=Antrihabitans spumae TaxID=3373370 RepID=A0ABW7JMM4_9NOCA